MRLVKDPALRGAIEQLTHAGCSLEMGGKHPQVRFPSGRKSSISLTPSCKRGLLNTISQLRKMAAAEGIELRR